MQSQLVSAHGMLAIMEVLESRTSRDVNLKLLEIVNTVRPILVLSFLLNLTSFTSWLLQIQGSWKASV